MMRTSKYAIMMTLAALIMWSCKPKQDVSGEPIDQTPAKDQIVVERITMMEGMAYPPKKDDFSVDTMRIKGDILEIDVTYSGCGVHEWTLFGNRFYRKSLPPQLSLFLWHDQHGDQCKKRFKQTLYFNIKKTRYPDKEENYSIFIRMNETDMQVPYRY